MYVHLSEFCCRHARGIEGASSSAATVGDAWKPFPLPGAPVNWSRDRSFDVLHIRIAVDVDVERRTVDGVVTHTVRPFADGLTSAEFDCMELDVSRVTAQGRRCRFTQENGKLKVELPAPA